MHKYFLIPAITFFIFIILLEIYQQYIDTDWKYAIIGKKNNVVIPDSCNDSEIIKIIKIKSDIKEGRSFEDLSDISNKNKIHIVYMLPCEVEDRKFDLNGKIENSIKSINRWFQKKSDNQIINFDKNKKKLLDITFIRINKTLNWFNEFNTNENNKEDTSSKIEKIIFDNSNIFNNFKDKKFIIFFEGWEKRVSISTEICGRSRLNGKVAIFYTNAKLKKTKSCTDDNLFNFDKENYILKQSEETILHEILHTLGAPPKCAKNINPSESMHVFDHKDDIMNKVSGSLYLDFNNDDYYKHNIPNCSDLFKSKFLSNLEN